MKEKNKKLKHKSVLEQKKKKKSEQTGDNKGKKQIKTNNWLS